MLHGWNTDALAPAADLMQIVGKCAYLDITNIRTNGSGDVGGTKYACLRLKADSGSVYPMNVQIRSVNLTTSAGHGIVVEKGDNIIITGTVDGDISGNDIRFEANSVVTRAVCDLASFENNASIDSSISNKVWGLVGDILRVNQLRVWNRAILSTATLPTGATPSVSNIGAVLRTNNSSPTTVANLTGTGAQVLWIYGADGGKTTFQHGANIKLAGSIDLALTDNSAVCLIQSAAGPWVEFSRQIQ